MILYETVFPPTMLVTAVTLFILPIIRWIEEKTEVWVLKTYTSIIWSIVIWIVTILDFIDVKTSGDKSFYPHLPLTKNTIEFVVNEHNVMLALIIGFLFIAVMFYSTRYLKWETLLDDAGMYKLYYYFLMFACYLGMLTVIYSNDAFTLFVGWELMVLPGYALIASRPRKKASEAAVKYALLSSIGSIFFFYGVATLYEITGELNLTRIQNYLNEHPELATNTSTWQTITFIIIGIGVTAGFVGMQTWAPDVYGEAPSSISAFISGGFALAAVIVFEKLIINTFPPVQYQYADIFLWGGILTMSLGNLGAVYQKDIRRFLGYSSIAQRGYLLFGIGLLAKATDSVKAISQAVYAQAIAYLLLEGVLFLAVGNILYLHWFNVRTRDITILQGSAKPYKMTAITIAVSALGLAGIPPTMGFVSKLSLFLVAGLVNAPYLAVFFFAINSVISVLYYARFIRNLVFTEPSENLLKIKEKIPVSMNFALFLIITVTIIMTVKPVSWILIL